ncbi:MAG: DNA-binding protein [Bacteroidia bacterium]
MEKTERSDLVVVCDAGPIIHLDELKQLHLFIDFEKVLIPESVWKEIKFHRPDTELNSFNGLIIQGIKPSNEILALTKIFTLHQGETDALELMRKFNTAIFLTDDTAARLAAKGLNYKVHGTIGILIRSIRRQLCSKDQIIALLRDLPLVSTLYIKKSLLNSIIQQLEEIPN